MLDKTNYIESRILQKLEAQGFFKENRTALTEAVVNLLKVIPNVDIMEVPAETFEASTISYVKFCKTVWGLLVREEEFTKENFIEAYAMEKEAPKSVSKLPDLVDEALLEQKEVNLDELLAIAEKVDFDTEVAEFFTEEGLRQYGIIENNITSLDGVDVVIKRADMQTVYLSEGDEIKSPYTQTTCVMNVGGDVYLDLENDQEFKVVWLYDDED